MKKKRKWRKIQSNNQTQNEACLDGLVFEAYLDELVLGAVLGVVLEAVLGLVWVGEHIRASISSRAN